MENNGFFTGTFNIEIARRFGTDSAIFLQNIIYWCNKNKFNGKHFYEGRYWTYNTADAFSSLFPFLTSRQVERIVNNLEKNGLLIVGNFNKNGYDRTKWFSVNETVYKSYVSTNSPNGEMDFTKRGNGFTQTVETIPDTLQILTTDVNSCATSYTFEQFWDAYGVKKNKHEAERKWKKLKPKEVAHIEAVLSKFLEDNSDVKFRPHPTTFINQKRWLDYEMTNPVSTTPVQVNQASTTEQRYWDLIKRIELQPRDNSRYTLEERRFIIEYQQYHDRFPPDERKLVQDTCSLTRAEIDQKDREEGWIS
jgi:hypothetical protein